MRIAALILLVAAGLLLSSPSVRADSAPEPGVTPPAGTEPSVADIVIGEVERRIIRDYYQRQYDNWAHEQGGKKHKKNKGDGKELPPGLAKRGELPPGLAKQLQNNGHLPPGLEKRDLPPDLTARLPALDPAYRYVIADNKVMLIRRATNLILDTLTVAAVDLLD